MRYSVLPVVIACFILLLVACHSSASPYPLERTYLLGDVDGFNYEGVGSEDDVYVDPDLITWTQAVAPGESNDDFDTLNSNNNVPFTFVYTLGSGEQITGATLELGLRATDSLVTNDWLVLPENDIWYTDLSNRSTQDVYTFSDLGWLPIASTGTTVRSVDLSNIVGDDQLSLVQDEEFTAYVTDDTAVDYAKLTITVVPEPATLAVLGLGGLLLLNRRRRSRIREEGEE